jgi:hypothetical protein
MGKLVDKLIDEQFPPGEYSKTWDGSNHPSGVYFIKLTFGTKTKTSKMILLK